MTDRAFEELQKRCKNLNTKRYLKYFSFFLIVCLIVAFAYFEYIKYKDGIILPKPQKVAKIEINAKPKPLKTIVKAVEKEKALKTEIVSKKQMVKVKKSKKENYNTVFLEPTIVIPKIEPKTKPKVRKKINNNISIPKEVVEPKIKPVIPLIKKQNKIVIHVKSLKSEEALLKDNKANENFETTLSLSDYYYKKAKFEKAINWSKKANHYKPSSFKPWLIYAKAKIRQGKKDEAIKAIETFLSYFNSEDAQKFLLSIRSKK